MLKHECQSHRFYCGQAAQRPMASNVEAFNSEVLAAFSKYLLNA